MSHGNCHGCGNIVCWTYGCQKQRIGYHGLPWPTAPQGCICPPTSEQTCMNPMCPRKPQGVQITTSATPEIKP